MQANKYRDCKNTEYTRPVFKKTASQFSINNQTRTQPNNAYQALMMLIVGFLESPKKDRISIIQISIDANLLL